MKSNSKKLLGAVLAAVGILVFWIWVMPLYSGISDLRSAVSERNDLLSGRSAIIAKIQDLNKQYQAKLADVKKISYVIPDKKNGAEIVSEIQTIASQSGLQLSSLSITDRQTDNNVPYNTVDIDFGLVGTYPSMTIFLTALEKNIRLIDLYSIDATPNSDNNSLIGFQLKATAYYLK